MKKILISTLLMMLAFTAIGQEKNKLHPEKGRLVNWCHL